VVYTADEPTGGTHMTLVLSGALGIDFDAAETLKRNKAEQIRLVPMLKPVLEKKWPPSYAIISM
jgi:ethanolamine utilization protein EutJ